MKFTGTVAHGDAYGRTLGFPTANIAGCEAEIKDLNPEMGIYAGLVQIGDSEIENPAAIVISEPNGEVKLEAYLLDFAGDLYGKTLTVTTIQFVRPYKHYETEVELIAAITADVENVRQILG